jgi:hypothetical protein
VLEAPISACLRVSMIDDPKPASTSFDVFICHATEHSARVVEPLVSAITGLGIKVWYDRIQVEAGHDFRLRMEEGLRASRVAVVLVSAARRSTGPRRRSAPSSTRRPWVTRVSSQSAAASRT